MNNGREPLMVGMLKVSDGELDMFFEQNEGFQGFYKKDSKPYTMIWKESIGIRVSNSIQALPISLNII